MARFNAEFVRVIDIPYAAEIIAERFDNALELMGNHAIVYGGAIRDIIAGLPIGGDLDIAANAHVYNQIVANFSHSSKWSRVGAGAMPNTRTKVRGGHIVGTSSGRLSGKAYPPKSKYKHSSSGATRQNPYGKSMPITATATFETFDNARVQVVRAKDSIGDALASLNSVFNLARYTDIRCCAFSLNSIGEVFELVDGAYIDCKDKVLRINEIKDPARFDNLEIRINKLVKRGWTSKINLAKVRVKLKQLRNKELEKNKVKMKKTAGLPHAVKDATDKLLAGLINIKKRKKSGYAVEISANIQEVIGEDATGFVDRLRYEYGLDCARVPSHPGCITYICDSRVTAIRIRNHFAEAVVHLAETRVEDPKQASEVYGRAVKSAPPFRKQKTQHRRVNLEERSGQIMLMKTAPLPEKQTMPADAPPSFVSEPVASEQDDAPEQIDVSTYGEVITKSVSAGRSENVWKDPRVKSKGQQRHVFTADEKLKTIKEKKTR